MEKEESLAQKDVTGLPFRKQVFGGYRKEDVAEYIENLVDMSETERATIDDEKKQFYDVMKQGIDFCKVTAMESKEKADTLLKESKEKSHALLKESQENADALLSEAQIKADSLVDEVQQKIDSLVTDAQQKADSILEDAQQRSDTMLQEAKKQNELLRLEYTQLLKQVRGDAESLANIVLEQSHEAKRAYEQLLAPLNSIISTCEERQDTL